jgi:uncharacterized protein
MKVENTPIFMLILPLFDELVGWAIFARNPCVRPTTLSRADFAVSVRSMEETSMSQAAGKPVPVPDEISAQFFDGARAGKLMLQHCDACDAWSFPVRERCPHCFAARLAWRQASGRGSLYTFTIMHQVMNPGFASAVPYNVAQVDLDEGVRMTSNIVGIDNDALRIGMRLEAVFEGETVSIPKFRPV